jgi:hypothetical protein
MYSSEIAGVFTSERAAPAAKAAAATRSPDREVSATTYRTF